MANSSRRKSTTTNGSTSPDSYDLGTRAMLANVEIHTWGGTSLDKKAGKEIAQQYDLGERVGTYRKWLLIRDENGSPARALLAVHNAGSAVRAVHHAHTLPWRDNGDRILSVENFMPWAMAVRDRQLQFDARAKELIDVYEDLKAETKEIMEHKKPGLYHEDDYPEAEELLRRFYVSIKHGPLPLAGDFRADLAAPQVEAIRVQMQRDTDVALTETTREIYRRMAEIAERVSKLGNPKSGVRDALADDVSEMAKLVGRLNFTNNPEVEAMRQRFEELEFNPGTIRRMRGVRVALAEKAEKIYSDLAAYMGEGE